MWITIHRSLSVLIKQMMKRFFLTVATVLSLCTLSAQDTVVAKVIAEEEWWKGEVQTVRVCT